MLILQYAYGCAQVFLYFGLTVIRKAYPYFELMLKVMVVFFKDGIILEVKNGEVPEWLNGAAC